MQFLCSAHLNELSALAQSEKMDLWFDWMAEAGSHSDRQNWPQVVSYAGCAFDLASTSLHGAKPGMVVEMILAAICLAEAIQKLAHPEMAEAVIELAVQRLNDDAPGEFASTLKDQAKRLRFFSDYMSWPALDGSAGPQRAANTIH